MSVYILHRYPVSDRIFSQIFVIRPEIIFSVRISGLSLNDTTMTCRSLVSQWSERACTIKNNTPQGLERSHPRTKYATQFHRDIYYAKYYGKGGGWPAGEKNLNQELGEKK